MSVFLNFLLVFHFGYHLIASIGGAWTFWHSYHEHKKGAWKLVAAVFWLIISVMLLIISDEHLHSC